MTKNSKMTSVSKNELCETTGGGSISYASIQFLQRTSNLTRMQVSALRYYNQMEDPAKYEEFMPGTIGGSMPGAPSLGG